MEIGAMILLPISNEDVRFVFQNINGLTTFTGVHKSLKARMVDLNGTVTALAETSVNWKNFKFRDDWEALLQQSYASLHFSHSSCNEGKEHQLQRGRTSMICNYRLGAKLLEKGSDTKLGGWSWMQFRGSHGTKVLVITAYQVSQKSAQVLGMDTFYMQQWRKLAKMKTKANPRAQFWEDLTSFIKTATADQAEVLTIMDANADTTNLEFSSFLVECGLHDLHNECDIVPPPETYYRGGKED